MIALQRLPVLVFFVLAGTAAGLTLFHFKPLVGGVLLDEIFRYSQSVSLIDGMTLAQKATHIKLTLFADMLFPLCYGLLLAGLTIRIYHHTSPWLVSPALLAAGVDILENLVQVAALSGHTNLLVCKSFLTPAKYGLVLVALCIVVFGALLRRFRKTTVRCSGVK